jgi:hypothetical protein
VGSFVHASVVEQQLDSTHDAQPALLKSIPHASLLPPLLEPPLEPLELPPPVSLVATNAPGVPVLLAIVPEGMLAQDASTVPVHVEPSDRVQTTVSPVTVTLPDAAPTPGADS